MFKKTNFLYLLIIVNFLISFLQAAGNTGEFSKLNFLKRNRAKNAANQPILRSQNNNEQLEPINENLSQQLKAISYNADQRKKELNEAQEVLEDRMGIIIDDMKRVQDIANQIQSDSQAKDLFLDALRGYSALHQELVDIKKVLYKYKSLMARTHYVMLDDSQKKKFKEILIARKLQLPEEMMDNMFSFLRDNEYQTTRAYDNTIKPYNS